MCLIIASMCLLSNSTHVCIVYNKTTSNQQNIKPCLKTNTSKNIAHNNNIKTTKLTE